jgi:signal transduction histidine kinase
VAQITNSVILGKARSSMISRHQEAEERAHGIEALRIADRRKDEFFAMPAHELRDTLAPTANASELLSRASGILARIKRSVARCDEGNALQTVMIKVMHGAR